MLPKTRRRNVFGAFAAALLIGGICSGTTGCSYIRAIRYRSRIRAGLLTPRRHGPARLEVRGNTPILHLYGTPHEMGTQYGTILKEPLQALDAYTRALLPSRTLQRYVTFAQGHERVLPPTMREELRAISKASGMSYMHLVAMNVLPGLRCSTLASWGKASKDGSLVMGRNNDYFSFGLSDRISMVVVYHTPKGVPLVAVTFIGMVGAFTGVNAEGVAFGNMLIVNARADRVVHDGLPIQIAMRLAAHQSKTADEMVRLLRARKMMKPMNVMAADAKEALVVELGLTGSRVRRHEGGVLAASNYFRTPELRTHPDACKRYRALTEAAKKHYGAVDVEVMKKALYAARLRGINLQAVVFEPAAMKMHLSINRVPASAGPYATLDVRKLLAAR